MRPVVDWYRLSSAKGVGAAVKQRGGLRGADISGRVWPRADRRTDAACTVCAAHRVAMLVVMLDCEGGRREGFRLSKAHVDFKRRERYH